MVNGNTVGTVFSEQSCHRGLNTNQQIPVECVQRRSDRLKQLFLFLKKYINSSKIKWTLKVHDNEHVCAYGSNLGYKLVSQSKRIHAVTYLVATLADTCYTRVLWPRMQDVHKRQELLCFCLSKWLMISITNEMKAYLIRNWQELLQYLLICWKQHQKVPDFTRQNSSLCL